MTTAREHNTINEKSNNNDDEIEVNNVLQKILQTINDKNTNNNANNDIDIESSLSALNEELLKISSSYNTMTIITKSLFLEKKKEEGTTATTNVTTINNNGKEDKLQLQLLNHTQSFQLLTYLVSTSPNKYLIPSSQCIYKQTQVLSSSNANTNTSFLLSNDNYSVIVPDGLLNILIDQLSYFDNVEVTENVSKSIILLCQCLPSLGVRAIPMLVTKWKDSITATTTSSSKKNTAIQSTISMRYASTITHVAIQSDTNMNELNNYENSYFLNEILNKINDNSDPLLQMSYLDLIEIMVQPPQPSPSNNDSNHIIHCAHWLLTSTLLQSLINIVDDPILSGSAIRLLSSICSLLGQDQYYNSAIFTNTTIATTKTTTILKSFRSALSHFDQRGETNRLAFIDAVSTFASSSSEALHVVLQEYNNDDTTTANSIRRGWLSLSHAHPKLKSVVLCSIAKVLDPIDDSSNNNNNCVIPSDKDAMLLIDTLSQVNSSTSVSTLLFTLVKSTIVEIRLGTYRLIKAMIKHSVYTAQLILSHSDAYDYLTNCNNFSNNIECTKEGKEAKFEIIVELMKHENVVNMLLNDDIKEKLDKIVKLGPFHVQSITYEMATE